MIKLKPKFQNVEIRCDESGCGHSEEFYGSLKECYAMAKNNGWIIEDKKQVCPGCVDFNRQNLERYQK